MWRAGRAAALLAAALAGAVPGRAADLGEKMAPCLACHGADGQSRLDGVPSLGAQPAPYTVIQLFLFREGLRRAEPMNDMTKGLSDDELKAIADAIAAVPAPKPAADAGDAARLAAARSVIAQNRCNFCHRPDFSGQENVPRLADQREDYLLKSLRAYKSQTRSGYDPVMVETLQPLDDAQLVELAYYLARVR
jgi:cytochrome c553